MNKKLAILFGFFFAVVLIIFVPLLIGLVFNSGGSQQPQQTTSNEKRKIVFWNLNDDISAFRGPFQTFESNNPSYGIEYVSFQDEETYTETLIKSLAEGWGPDIFTLNGRSIRTYRDLIQPIPSGRYGVTPESFESTFVPSVSGQLIERLSNEELPKILGVPLFVDSLAIYYNQRYFQDFLPSEGKPGKFWTDIIRQTKSLNKQDNSFERFSRTGIALGLAENISKSAEILSLMLLQLQTPFYDTSLRNVVFSTFNYREPDTGQPVTPSERALDLYTSFARPSFDHYSWNELISRRFNPDNEISAFARGKTSMILGDSQTIKDIEEVLSKLRGTGSTPILESSIKVSEIPQFSDDSRDALAITYPLFVSQNSEYQDKAFELITFLSSPDNVKNYLDQTGKPPAITALISEYSTKENVGVFALQSGFAKNLNILNWENLAEEFDDAIDTVINQYDTIQAVVRNIDSYLNCELNIYNKNFDVLVKGCE